LREWGGCIKLRKTKKKRQQMEERLRKFIRKLEEENVKRKYFLMYNNPPKEVGRRMSSKYEYTCEIIQELRNCYDERLKEK
jgi:hypothetical protein